MSLTPWSAVALLATLAAPQPEPAEQPRPPKTREITALEPLLDQIVGDDEIVLRMQPEHPAQLDAEPGSEILTSDTWFGGGGSSALVLVKVESTRVVLARSDVHFFLASIASCVVERVEPLVHPASLPVGGRFEIVTNGGELMVGRVLLRDVPGPWARAMEAGGRYVAWVPPSTKEHAVVAHSGVLEITPDDRLLDMVAAPKGTDRSQQLTGQTLEWLVSRARQAVAKWGPAQEPLRDAAEWPYTVIPDPRARQVRRRVLGRQGPLLSRLRSDDDVIEVRDSAPAVRLATQPRLRDRLDDRGSGVLDFVTTLPGLTLAVVDVQSSAPALTADGSWIEWRTDAKVVTPIIGGGRAGQPLTIRESGGELKIGSTIVRAGYARMLEPFLPGRRYLALSYTASGGQTVWEAWYIERDSGALSYINADGVGGRPWQEALANYDLTEVIEALKAKRRSR
jgi:hypothetical protein